ncbi:hypothetical protein [Pedobacter heparinus]|uniref:hypothetical protein n=1 Tax=Pedobacter heparinus TaxID=984 RepID=UPI0029315FA0|nr:hypothetical protein [Pedobacter heparinus]
MMMFVYAVLVFLVLRFSVTLFNFLSNPKLGYYGKHFTDKVSIIILSARAEGDIKNTVDAIGRQEYKNIELLVQQQGANEEELVGRASGKYLLFLRAGTTPQHGLINSLIYRFKIFDLAALSLVPTYVAAGFMEKCIYPLNDFLLLNLLPLRLIRLSNQPAFAAGSNACLFLDANLCKQQGWHQKIGHKLGMEMVKLVKQQHFKAEVLLGNKLIFNKVSLGDLEGFSERLLINFGNSALVAFIYLVLVVAGPMVLLISFNPAFAVLPFGLIFLSRIMIAFMTAQNPVLQVLLHPLQMLLLFVFTGKAIWMRMLRSFKPKK